jgi:hypothetical protein
MHLTLKKEATRPPGMNSLQRQARFDTSVHEFNIERPHEALAMKCPAEVYATSNRSYGVLPDLAYPLHDRDILVTASGRIYMHRAVDSVSVPQPENRILGPKGTTHFVVPESEKESLRQAIAARFDRDARKLPTPTRSSTRRRLRFRRINNRLTNPRRNEVHTAAVAAGLHATSLEEAKAAFRAEYEAWKGTQKSGAC